MKIGDEILERNIRIILDACFSGYKDEIIDAAEKKIMELIKYAEDECFKETKRELLEALEKTMSNRKEKSDGCVETENL